MSIPMTYQEQLLTPEWIAKAAEIRERDGYTCRKCPSNQHLQVHHHRYINGLMAWGYPNYMLITLCELCHAEHHGKDERFHRGRTLSMREAMIEYVNFLHRG